jgi:uncharacterized membrane protein YgcG
MEAVIALVVVGLVLVTMVALTVGGNRGDTSARWHQNRDSRMYRGDSGAGWTSGGGWDGGGGGGGGGGGNN